MMQQLIVKLIKPKFMITLMIVDEIHLLTLDGDATKAKIIPIGKKQFN